MITKTCIFLACLCIWSHGVNCAVHNVSWTLQYLNSINNQIAVGLGDELRLICPEGSTDQVLYGEQLDNYNNCSTNCNPVGSCGHGVVEVQIGHVPLSCLPNFQDGTVRYLINNDATTCLNGFRLKVKAGAFIATSSATITTTKTGGNNKGSATTSKLPMATPTSSVDSTRSVVSPSLTVSPNVGRSETVFVDWSIEAQAGLVGGVAVLLLLIVIVVLVIICFLYVKFSKSSRSADLVGSFERENSTTLMLDDVDGKKGDLTSSSSSFNGNHVSSNNRVKPALPTSTQSQTKGAGVVSPKRPPPNPPNSTNGGNVGFSKGQDKVTLGSTKPTTRAAPPPPSKVTQSVQNYNRKANASKSPMKSV